MRRDKAPSRDRAQRIAALDRVPREVVELLEEAQAPLKAYDLLWRLQTKRGRPAPPSSIYRALKALIDAGFVHKIEGMNAYVLCSLGANPHQPAFLICEICSSAQEVDASAECGALVATIRSSGFLSERIDIAARGCCARCARRKR